MNDMPLGCFTQWHPVPTIHSAPTSQPCWRAVTEENAMSIHAITGITGKVGGTVSRALLSADQRVRSVVRDPNKGRFWSDLGCEVAIAGMEDAEALTRAFRDVTGVFVLPPSNFDPEPGFPEAKAVISAVRQALLATRPAKVVFLSTIGAQATQSNLLTQRTLMEEALSTLPLPITFLRPAWFMENLSWDIAQARDQVVISCFLQPLDKACARRPLSQSRRVRQCSDQWRRG